MPRPFGQLPLIRDTSKASLPTDLAVFYAEYEGNGLELSPEEEIRLCRLEEVERVGPADILVLQEEVSGWERFSGLRIGVSPFGDDMVYVTSAPVCPAGAILLLGPDVSGPGGDGPAVWEPTLMLASTFAMWLRHLEQNDWMEYGVYPGALKAMEQQQRESLRRYYRELNPHIDW